MIFPSPVIADPAKPSNAAPMASSSAFAPPSMPPAADQTWHLDMIGANIAYGRGYTGAGVAVAVGDTGFDVTHPSLAGKLDLSRAYSNLVINGETYHPGMVDIQLPGDSHGTHVAGIIAAKNDPSLSDSHGVAYGATIVPIRTIFDTDVADEDLGTYIPRAPIADAIDYFTSLTNVKVLNASFGPSFDPANPLRVWPESPASIDSAAAAFRALGADKIIVAANGNDRGRHPVAGLNPSGLALYPYIRPEHAQTGVYDDFGTYLDFSSLQYQPGLIIGVMAVGRNKDAAPYSNLCGVTASWCVAAPGGDQSGGQQNGGVFSTIPRGEYQFYEGTSMATPVVSGAIAVLISAYPDYAARDLAQVLFSTAEDLGLPGVDRVFGHGLIRLDRATDGPTTLASDHHETVAANVTTYWSQPLTTSSAFTKDGEGVLTIAGRTAAPGDVQVAQGTLSVDGTLSVTGAGHALRVGTGGTLAGMGTIFGDTTIAGMLSPGKMANVQDLIATGAIASPADISGNSAGQLFFNGNVTLASGATTRIDVDGWYLVPGGPGTHDRIIVNGAGNVFTANGALTPVLRGSVGTPSNYTPGIGTNLAFIEAINGAHTTGAFTSLQQPVSGLPANGRFDLIYAPTAITLAVTPDSFAGMTNGAPLSRNQQGVAGILDSHRPEPGAMPDTAAKALYDALYGLPSPGTYGTAMTQLSGVGQLAATAAEMTSFSGFMGSISERQNTLAAGAGESQSGSGRSIALAYAGNGISAEARQADAAFASMQPVAPSQDGWAVWGQSFGRWSSVGGSDAAPGSSSRSGGFTIGADRSLADDLIGGVAVGFARTGTSAGGASATSDTYAGAVYASWSPGNAVFDLRASAGPTQMHMSRNIILTPGAITSNATGFGGSVGAEAGYRIALGHATVKPFVGLTWQGLRRGGYSETNLPFGLAYPAQSFDKLTTTAGLSLSTTRRLGAATLMPELRLAWGHDLRDTTLISQAALLDTAFTVVGADPGRDAALVSFRLAGWERENFQVFGSYNGEFRSNAVSHQFSGGARYTW